MVAKRLSNQIICALANTCGRGGYICTNCLEGAAQIGEGFKHLVRLRFEAVKIRCVQNF